MRAISFTGSTATGNRIVKAAGLKKFSMELGGKSPFVIFDDADLDRTVARIAEANKMTVVQFRDAFERDGVPFTRFREDLRNEVVVQRLREREITFGLLGVLRDVPDDEQAVANGAIVESAVPEMPRTITAPIRLSFAAQPTGAGPGPRFGEHTDQVLGELGYSAADIKRLREAKAVA